MTLEQARETVPNGFRMLEDGEPFPNGQLMRVGKYPGGEWIPYHGHAGGMVHFVSLSNYYAAPISVNATRKEW